MTPPARRGATRFTPAQLDADQRALYDAIVGGPRASQTNSIALVDDAGRLEGPFNAFLLQPALGQALQALGATLRYKGTLDDRRREIAILVVAAVSGAEFERQAHEPIAKAAGVSSEQLDGIRIGDLTLLAADDELIARAARALAVRHDVDDDMWAALRCTLGEDQAFELIALVGYYCLLASVLNVLG